MASTERSRGGSAGSGPAEITPVLPLLLLETMRDMDRPEEVLEDEDVTISLPRRLGLSDVVGVQIRRLQDEVRQRRLQSGAQVTDLMRLVLRRPDAEAIFEEAGRRFARRAWESRSVGLRKSLRWMPRALTQVAAHRATKRMLRNLTGGSRVAVNRWPPELRIQNAITARADPGGAACAFYGGAFSELLQFYTARRYRVVHAECETRGGALCHWRLEVLG